MELINRNYRFFKQHFSPAFVNELSCLKLDQINHYQHQFYGDEVRKSCEEQVSLFLKHPTHLRLNYVSDVASEYAHQICINTLNKRSLDLGCKANSKPQRGTLVLLGLGAGHHLNKLLSSIHYTDVIVVESNVEQYAMAGMNINLDAINKECEARQGSLTFLNIASYEHFISELRSLMDNKGAHLLVDISLYRHYSTPVFDQIYSDFKQWRNNLASMWGFFEDELIGLKHSIENSHKAVVKSHAGVFEEYKTQPIVIVGNGPSLDNELEKLCSDTPNVLIASCGTSLGSLLKRDIVPDFHIEMERPPSNFYLKEHQLTDPRVKKVVLISLNTVYPKLIEQFKHAILFAKSNDAGGELLWGPKQGVTPLFHCNPTVTNMAAAAFARLGFNNLILLGCDYGYIDPKNHHSKLSDYFNKASDLSGAQFDAEMRVKGNFEEFVYSSRIFNEARLAQEQLIKLTPLLNVLNASNGAFISGSTPTKYSEVLFKDTIKEEVKQCIYHYTHSCATRTSNQTISLDEIGKIIANLKRNIATNGSIVELLNELNKAVKALNNHNSKVSKLVLSGSLKYIVATIASHVNHLPSSMWPDYAITAREAVNAMLAEFINKLSFQ
ncbi:hypothetical protein N474_22020 [Pseudoalteromonas luteoviolacea CPMOR-2]|uniref:motility associated factor glycosyltransferase family protein n=1 Tax=Pseudoalteromonas luteoviolacea TaxID=43657 RepID=UPI0007B08818|nr:6-hydroxymethylpterin diphosphokinase MptE-like protein [Pseudoalteromonas luteoviolacea]KZN53075.1 hypothetical protein N474_22020 [Pseudoalteromonas luteoviolacea CPMOR-2]